MFNECGHHHTREHIMYMVGSGDTEFDEGGDAEYGYTIKLQINVCVNCLFIVREKKCRVVWLVVPKLGTNVIKVCNFKDEAKDHAKFVNGNWMEAEVTGSL